MRPTRTVHILVFSCATALILLGSPSRAGAAVPGGASIFLSPAGGTFTVGSTFTVSILLNTGGQSVNAVEANISFPPDKLQVVSPTTGKSFIGIWVSQPTYSNAEGTIRYQGTVPNPGINTDAGVISTVTFRVRSTGQAVVGVTDSSRVLLNDGRGTDVLSEKGGGIYTLTLPPPAGPVVASRTNPDQQAWYHDNLSVFEWVAPADVEGYSYILSDSPVDDPDDTSEGVQTRVVYRDLPDGVHYFHIKALRGGVWGGVTSYEARIDATPPAVFKLSISPGTRTSNRRPILDFTTTDAVSGIDHYELKIISLDVPQVSGQREGTPFFIEATSPYSRELDRGRYDVVVRAFDEAGNFRQAQQRIRIVSPLFEVVDDYGVRLFGALTLSWPYAGLLGIVLVFLLARGARFIWREHRTIEEYLHQGALKHPDIVRRLQQLREKEREYLGKVRHFFVFFLSVALGASLLLAPVAFAQNNQNAIQDNVSAANVTVEPPVVTLFPQTLSNDEIFYIGGRAGAPDAEVLVYVQNSDSGSTIRERVTTDKTGAWFYSLPQFLSYGRYVVWTQLKVGDAVSPPSSRLDLTVERTAIQVGGGRLSFEDLYFFLFLIFVAAFGGLLGFTAYHGYHLRVKKDRLAKEMKEAEESIRRGFALLRQDIEKELELVRKAKLRRDLAGEEKMREEKLLKDLEDMTSYIGKEVWEAEEAGKQM